MEAIASGSLKQFNGEKNTVAGKNIIASFESGDTVIFNETYTILGPHTKALKIHAIYDLIVLGDLSADECVVNGSLTVIGDVHISRLICNNSLICNGSITSDAVYAGGDITASSIDCDSLTCEGNVVLKTTANINQSAKIGRTIVACEGIMGEGSFFAQNAIANEYFEFDGDCEGRIIELETGKEICSAVSVPQKAEDILSSANQIIAKEYRSFAELTCDEIIRRLKELEKSQGNSLKILPIIRPMLEKLADISHKGRIGTVDEYLTALTAKKILPKEICSVESLRNIFDIYLPQAESEADELIFEPYTVEQFSRALIMVIKSEREISESWEDVMDAVFESIGIKYTTVCSMIRRNVPDELLPSESENH